MAEHSSQPNQATADAEFSVGEIVTPIAPPSILQGYCTRLLGSSFELSVFLIPI